MAVPAFSSKPPKFLDEPSGKAERGGWGSEQAPLFSPLLQLQRYKKYPKPPNISSTFFALFFVLIPLLDVAHVLVETEDGTSQEKGLGQVHSGTDPIVHFFGLFLAWKYFFMYLCQQKLESVCPENRERRAARGFTT